ncbi:MAG: DUF2892 domain-containing protein [Bacteroidales bacterium]|jgi:hypothetical protein|nr:DUF2892 domain-containing protein [Bacteroidales bacterium]MDD4383959.1 DUF2892 domain-containing protein [Bacteroidales bacterium]MDY0196364.1 DUF2892 domain-containing protein [Tenuifilaceae bacterium]
MKHNIGTTDKTIRIIIGLAIAALGIYYQSWWGLIAILPLATAFTSFCGLYTILGINTCPAKKKA